MRSLYLDASRAPLTGLCERTAAGRLEVMVIGTTQYYRGPPAEIEGYVNPNHYDQIRTHDPVLAKDLLVSDI